MIRRPAFTLLEMLVAVGAVGLIAVGLARLFSSTGDTVRIGRRISLLNDAAAVIQRQLERDLRGITRDGAMVICNRKAAGGSAVALGADDTRLARERRVDSLVFFSTGRFTSARQPLHPSRTAVANAARVYWGHGARREAAQANLLYLDDAPTGVAATTWPSELGAPNTANQYAGGWVLLRNAVLLATPQPAGSSAPAPPYSQAQWDDSPLQIGLQPAAASVFNTDMGVGGSGGAGGYAGAAGPNAGNPVTVAKPAANARLGDSAPVSWPNLSSGIVDIAAIDLDTVRTRLMGAAVIRPSNGSFLAPYSQQGGTNYLPVLPYDSSANAAGDSGVFTSRQERTRPRAVVHDPARLLTTSQNTSYAVKRLMAGLMPGHDGVFFGSDTSLESTNVNALTAFPTGRDLRMPCDAAPPDFTGARSGSPHPATQPFLNDDQLMLTASNIAVGCTEFIVEWSFGEVFEVDPNNPTDPRAGNLVWHGLERRVDFDDDGTATAAGSAGAELAAFPYTGQDTWNASGPFAAPLYGKHPHTVFSDARRTAGLSAVFSSPVPPGLIHWPANTGLTAGGGGTLADGPLYSFFAPRGVEFGPYNVVLPDGTKEDFTLPWPWPRLIRVTFSLTDPSDPTTEQTYQFVFPINPDTARAQ